MTAKEKAEDLLNKFDYIIYTDQNPDRQIKQCALATVDEMIKLIESKCFNKQFFIKVKQEIEKL